VTWRLDTADRTFFALVALALVPYAIVAVLGCGVVSAVAYDVATRGPESLSAGLLPALAVFARVAAGTVLAAAAWRAQVQATRRLGAHVARTRVSLPERLAEAARREGLAGRVDCVDGEEPFSFAYGLRRSRVAVSRGLVETLDDEALRAVLAHERHHVAHLDPLKVVVARVLARAYFFLPALRSLRQRYATASELAADRRAVRRCGRAAVAGALYRVVAAPAWPEVETAAAMASPDALDARVRQLETGEEPPTDGLSRGAAAFTVLVLALLVASVAAAMVAAGPAEWMGEMGRRRDWGRDGAGPPWVGVAFWVAVAGAVLAARRRRLTTTRT
jgi:Zn-dependent protease with chaperone function